MKKIFVLCSFILLILGLTACKTDKEKKNIKLSSSTESTYQQNTTESSKKETVYQYRYNPDRTLWVTIPETGEALKADGNFLTVIAMESVLDTSSRKLLQSKYDEGYALNLEVKDNKPTGTIYLLHATKGDSQIAVSPEKIDISLGKKVAEKLSNDQKPDTSKEISDVTAQTPDAKITTFDEAVTSACDTLQLSKENYLFYDFGLGTDRGEYYTIEIRKKDTEDTAPMVVKVYTLTGEVLQESN